MIGIIPAAGKGTRFHELGRQYPKCILPYMEVPIIIHNIRKLISVGCDEIIIGVNHLGDMVEDVIEQFGGDRFFQTRVVVVDVGETMGMPETILKSVKEGSIYSHDICYIMLGDIICKTPLPDTDFDWVSVEMVSDFERWCMVEIDNGGLVSKFIDKPKERPDTEFALSGIYSIGDYDSFIGLLEEFVNSDQKVLVNGELQLSTILEHYSLIREMRPEVLEVKDLGTHKDFINNRGIGRCRAFNSVEMEDNLVIKKSNDIEKMRKEFHWLNDIPDPLKSYTPTPYTLSVDSDVALYSMQRISKPTLREMFLFLDSNKTTWNKVFSDLFNVVIKFNSYKGGMKQNFLLNNISKTASRWELIDDEMKCEYESDFLDMMEFISDMVNDVVVPESIIHGDLCFSNILWSEGDIKLIDPRGEYYGSIYYEMAKLYHSVFGYYDFIDAELYNYNGNEVTLYNKGKEDVQNIFMEHLTHHFTKYEITFIKMLTASLFASMVPLHYHNKTNQHLFLEQFRKIFIDAKTDYFSL